MHMAKRRERGEGSIFFDEAKDLFVGTISLGTDPSGKRRRSTVYAKTKVELVVKLRELKAKPPEASDPGASQTLRDYLTFWLAAILTAGCKPKTHECYERAARNHITPYLGAVPVTELNAYHAHQLFAALSKAGATAYTQRYAFRVLRSALTYAVEPLRTLPHNPMFGVKAPKHVTKIMSTWTPEQCGAFLTSTADDWYHAAYVLQIDLGIREGEMLSLYWENVDFQEQVIHVRTTLNCIRGKITGRGEPKTAASKRTIPMTPRVSSVLRHHRAILMERGLAACPWVVPTKRGGPVNPSNFLRAYGTAVEAAGLPYICPHELRHSHATILVKNGVAISDISERLGHGSKTTTLNTYVHSDLEQQRKVTEKFAEIMGGTAS